MLHHSRRTRSRLARIKPVFGWHLEDEGRVELSTCASYRISVNPHSNDIALAFPYRLTVFTVGKKPQEVSIEPDAEGQISFVVKEPIGAEFMLRLRNAQGIDGGFLPSVFQAVAGITTSCINSTSSGSVLPSRPDVAGKWNPSSLDLGVVGGIPPYDVTVALLGPASPSVMTMPLSQFQSFRPIQATKTRALIAAVSDSNGEWVSRTSFIHLQDSAVNLGSNPTISVTVNNSTNTTNPTSVTGTEAVMDLRTSPTHSSDSQHIFSKRDQSEDGGSLIMILDAVILALLLGLALAVAIRELILRRRKKRQAKKERLARENIEASPPAPSATGMDGTMQEPSTGEGIAERYNSSSEDLRLIPPELPVSSVTDVKTSSPPSFPPSAFPLPDIAASPVPLPESYGDPYPSSTREMYGADLPLYSSRRSSSARPPSSTLPTSLSRSSSNRRPSMLSRGPSFSSLFSAKASRFTRFSETYSHNEPALSDARSLVLAREISRSSSAAVLGPWGNNGRQSSVPSPSGESDITEGGWRDHSSDPPAVPPLVFKHWGMEQ
ncbi:hypothetical protein GALMADRAFT_1116614 [Galerina marginata CBS 339.88]|uniref:Uncharacterized protein n=1 Tax=Galerina marginata (strain CBS 339.88) TaxID=685588 RepID=A0A067TF53_GALM3|nr:hypothetical protein GALMADRAFT_1116614 [Galerina marginata CBS 339.88]